MRDAISGIFNIVVLMVFIVIITALIALALNYTRAYRVKNNILTYIEKYEGNMETSDTEMYDHIEEYIESVGYRADSLDMSKAETQGYTCVTDQGWCYKVKKYPSKEIKYVNIVVFINLRVPFISQLFSQMGAFQMRATTSAIPILE